MEFQTVVELVKARFPRAEAEFDKNLIVEREDFLPFIDFIRTTWEVNVLDLLTASDHPAEGQLHLIYGFYSYSRKLFISVKVRLGRETPSMPSLTAYWASANWLEREVFDLFGVEFAGHPDLRRILTPVDFKGHGLRKDYERPGFFVRKPDFK